jgi:Uma2 family endonuclease
MLVRMGDPAIRRATWADLEALPENVVGELIRGVLYTMPRPRPKHQSAGSVLGADLNGPFQRGRGGPGGWWILIEPGLAFPALDVEEIVPDLAGWRREHLPALPERSIEVAPDWVCEILSPSTRRHDQRIKRPLYAEAGVRNMWVVDVDARTVVVSRNEGGRWMELGVWAESERMRAEPFDAIELALADLWDDGAPTP